MFQAFSKKGAFSKGGLLAGRGALTLGSGGGLPAGFGTASLYHDFTRQQYVGAPAPSITRASTKTVFTSAGLMSTVAAGALAISDRGLSIEESRQNLCLRSEELNSSASWTGFAAVTADTDISPDGTMDADTLTASGSANQALYQTVTVSPSTVYTFSEFVRLGTMLSSEFKLAFYDVTNNAFIATEVPPSVTLVPTGYLRTSHVVTTPAGCVSMRVYAYRSNAAVAAGKTASPWGTSLEVGPFATSYMPTTTAPVTRAADVITIPSPTSYVSLAQGGAFVEWTDDTGPAGVQRYLWSMRMDAANAIRALITSSNKLQFEHLQAGVSVATTVSTNPVVAGMTYKAAASWTPAGASFAVSPAIEPSLRTIAVGAAPTGTPTFWVGANNGGTLLNASLRRLALWQTGPSNAELQALVA